MELRQLSTDRERQIFASCLEKARATRGLGFREKAHSQVGKAHLMFGNLYALFEDSGEPAERMVAGFILHDLATLPQSHPKPDVSHLPPRLVIEGGELWSLSHGAGRVARAVGAAVAGILQARAILLYSVYSPMDLTPGYKSLGFVEACEPVLWPYVETLDGGDVWIQPLILQDHGLEEYIRAGFDYLFKTSTHTHAFRFDRPFPRQSEESAPPVITRVKHSPQSAETNGATHLGA